MVAPLILTVKLAKSIMESLREVRSNYEECECLGRLTKRTLVMVSQIEGKSVANQSLSEALSHVNEVLEGAQATIDDCCNTDCLCALLLYQTRSFELKKAAKALDYALIQIPLEALGETLSIQDNLATMVDAGSHRNFDKPGFSARYTNVLETEFEEVSLKMDRGFEDTKSQIGTLIPDVGLGLDTSGALTLTIYLVKDLSFNVQKVKTNKENCRLLAKWAERTLRIFKRLEKKELSSPMVLSLLHHVNKALYKVKYSIDDCCNTNVFHGVIFYERYSLRLKRVATALEAALCMIPWALDGMPLSIESGLSGLCKGIRLHLEQTSKTKALYPTPSNNGQFYLHLAASNNLIDTIKELISSGHDFDGQNNYGQTPLCIASRKNHIEIVRELIANGAKVDLVNKDGESPLYIASTKGHIGIVKELIANGANVDLPNKSGASPIHVASKKNHIYVVKELIANGAEVNLLNENRASPLYFASKENHIEVVNELIANGADVNMQENNGASSLCGAATFGHIEIVKKLISNSADVNLQMNNGLSPLHIASYKNQIDVVKELIAKGAEVNLQNKNGASPLYISSKENHIEVVKELIANGVDVNLQMNDGCSPLHIASFLNHINVVKELIANDASIDLHENNGWTSLHMASQENHIDVLKELIVNNANVNVRTKRGDTPLHIAASCGRVHVVQMLVEHGASKTARNNRLQNPYHVVCNKKSCGPYEKATIEALHFLLRK